MSGILETIYTGIGFDQGLFALLAGNGISMLHTHNTGKAFFVDVLKYIEVIDLPGGRFLSAGIIPYLEVGYFFPGQIHVGNQVSFLDLLVVKVI
jgi:hypothetical protein